MASSVRVDVSEDGEIYTITIDRAHVRNAVDQPTANLLASTFRRFDNDPQAKVAILAGAGGTFCSGADLAAVAEGGERMNRVEPDGDGPMGPTRMQLTKPVIAAITGHAVAGGLELALWCDLRVVEEGAIMGVFCRRWGVPLIDGGTVRLPRIVGHGRAMDLILTGRPVHADEALAMGLATRVVPAGTALDAATELARQIAKHPQQCMRNDMKSTCAQWSMSERDALAFELRIGMESLKEARTGAAKFVGGAGRGGADVEPADGPRIRAVVFDVGGVLVESPLHVIARYEQSLGLPKGSLGGVIMSTGDSGAFAQLERGEVTVDEFAKPFEAECEAAGLRGVDGAGLLARMCREVNARPLFLEALDALKEAGIKTAALTNNFLLDHVFESCRLGMLWPTAGGGGNSGMRKPEPRIYEHTLAAMGVRAQETAFLDDLGHNLKAAARLGMHTIRVGPGPDGPRAALAELEKLTKLKSLGRLLLRSRL